MTDEFKKMLIRLRPEDQKRLQDIKDRTGISTDIDAIRFALATASDCPKFIRDRDPDAEYRTSNAANNS